MSVQKDWASCPECQGMHSAGFVFMIPLTVLRECALSITNNIHTLIAFYTNFSLMADRTLTFKGDGLHVQSAKDCISAGSPSKVSAPQADRI